MFLIHVYFDNNPNQIHRFNLDTNNEMKVHNYMQTKDGQERLQMLAPDFYKYGFLGAHYTIERCHWIKEV